MEFFTDGNLIINSTGGLNKNPKQKNRAWIIYRGLNRVRLNISGNELLTINMSYKKISELLEFFDKHKVHFTIK